MPRLIACLFAIFLILTSLPATAAESPQPAANGGVRTEDLQKLVKTLENDGDRARLVGDLKALIAAQKRTGAAEDTGILGDISDRLQTMGEDAIDAISLLETVPDAIAAVAVQLTDPDVRERWGRVIVTLASILLAAGLADAALSRLLRRSRRALEPTGAVNPWVRAPLTIAHAALDLIPVAACAASGYGVLMAFQVIGNARVAAVLVITAYASVRAIMVLARMLASPDAPTLRLLPVEDESAEYLVIWTRRLAGVGVFGYYALEAARLLGLPKTGHAAAMKGLGLAIAVMLAIFVLQNRQAVGIWLRSHGQNWGRRMQRLRNRFADVWHVLAILYIVAGYGVWASKIKGGFDFMLRASVATVIILVIASLISGALRRGINRGFAISQDVRDRFPRLEERANRYLPILHVVLRACVAIATLLTLMQAWGLDGLGLLTSDVGRRVVSSAVSIVAVLVGALIIWELVSGAIERYLQATNGDGEKLERSARARTLLPLLRNALLILLSIMVALIVLSELGVNIAPLLAGAGVVGIAIGFGSQKLVQDVITGAFILFEDTIAVGDVVNLGSHGGVVEAMSIRAIRLRDTAGAVHTVPFSAVGTVINMSKQFAFAVFDIGVAYREDPDQVMALMRDIGKEMREDPAFGPLVVEDLEILGLERFDASAVVIRARFKTVPLKQWTISREFNLRLKRRFDAEGVEMPFPQTTVWFGEDKKGYAPPARLQAVDSPEDE